jgi:ribosomal protein L16 Arg81 hydroxylase
LAAQPDFDQHPLFEKATVCDFLVNAGEILFIPKGWWHHLESLDISVSITRKNLALSTSNSFGAGFIKESTNFSVGKLD